MASPCIISHWARIIEPHTTMPLYGSLLRRGKKYYKNIPGKEKKEKNRRHYKRWCTEVPFTRVSVAKRNICTYIYIYIYIFTSHPVCYRCAAVTDSYTVTLIWISRDCMSHDSFEWLMVHVWMSHMTNSYESVVTHMSWRLIRHEWVTHSYVCRDSQESLHTYE